MKTGLRSTCLTPRVRRRDLRANLAMKVAITLISVAFAGALLAPSAAQAKPKHEHVAYPMKADAYKKRIEARINAVGAAIDKKLDHAGVSVERKKAIHKIIDETAKGVRAELDKAAADGTVTREEAAKVDALAARLRGDVKAKLAAERTQKAREKSTAGDDAKKSSKKA